MKIKIFYNRTWPHNRKQLINWIFDIWNYDVIIPRGEPPNFFDKDMREHRKGLQVLGLWIEIIKKT